MPKEINHCSACGRFRKYDEIIGVDNGYDEVSGEYQTWTECAHCCSEFDYDSTLLKKLGPRDVYLKREE